LDGDHFGGCVVHGVMVRYPDMYVKAIMESFFFGSKIVLCDLDEDQRNKWASRDPFADTLCV